MTRYILFLILLMVSNTIFAQDMMETVNVTAGDELMLVGDIHTPETLSEDTPIVLLLHMLGSHRGAYEPILPDLLSAGYIVLNIDMRGHGDTGGARNWELALDDLVVWADWLHDEGYVGEITIIGASIGSNIALMGCAELDDCIGAIALSPGLDYVGVTPQPAFVEGFTERSALLVAAHGDAYSAETITTLFTNATGDVTARLYAGRSHGTNFFRTDYDSVSALIVNWLDEHVKLASDG